MAPPLIDPLLLANMESIALVLQFICTMHNKIKASDITLTDFHALLLHMLHAKFTSTASWYLWCWWQPIFCLCCHGLCSLASTKMIATPKKEEIHLMHKHIKTLIKLINMHRIMYKCQYKSATAKKSSLCLGSAIHAQQTNNSIKIEDWTSGWMLVKMHDCERGLCNGSYAPAMPTCQNCTPLQYFGPLCKGMVIQANKFPWFCIIAWWVACPTALTIYFSGAPSVHIGESVVQDSPDQLPRTKRVLIPNS